MNETIFPLVGMGLLLIGVGFLLGGLIVFIARWEKWSEYQKTTGKVVDIVSESVTPGNPYYFPVVEFRAPNGKTVRFKSQVGSYPKHPSKGENVRVMFDPARPGNAEIEDAWTKWFVPGGLAFLGIIALILGGMILYLT